MLLCREAQLEKKAARREATKEREQSPEMNKLPGGGDIMGGDDSFAAARARYRIVYSEKHENKYEANIWSWMCTSRC